MTREPKYPDDVDSDQVPNPDADATWNPPDALRPTEGPGLPPRSPLSPRSPDSGPTVAYDQSHNRHQTVPVDNDGKDSEDATPGPGGDLAHEDSEQWDRLPPPEFLPGAVVFGKYRLIKMLGEGGMGQVWLVDNLELDCKSALKLIKPEIAKNEKAWRRFKREAQVMAKLEHPNAIAVRAFHRTQSVAYIEMEYVRGDSLDKILLEQQGKPMPQEWVVPILDQLCEVLQEAHDYVDENTGKPRPIIHRDLKPSNLMLLSKGTGKTLKVLDFGIAKMADDDRDPKFADNDREAQLTGEAEFLGTAGYSSPEQIRGDPVDGRSDLYSVGVMLYQFLTGSLPFKGGVKRSLIAHLTETPKPLRETNPTAVIFEEVERLVLQCLEKDPDRRPRSARELADRFRAAVSGTVVKEKEKEKEKESKPFPKARARARSPAWKEQEKESKPFPIALLASLAVMLSTIAGAGVIAWKMTRPTPITITKNTDPKTGDTTKPAEDLSSSSLGHPVSKGSDSGKSAAAVSTTIANSPSGSVWEVPKGYKAVGLEPIPSDGPILLERIADHVKFKKHAETGLYFPIGYQPEDSGERLGGWPKALVYILDGTRFIRIPGGTFEQGDFLASRDLVEPISDPMGNRVVPHWVELSGFYIQETEVTNGQVAVFVKDHPGELPEAVLEDWKEYNRLLTWNGKESRKYPAVALDQENAARIASAFGALLPTESQFEYASRSGGLGGPNNLFATMQPVAKGGKPKAHLSGNEDDKFPPMKMVKFYDKGRDETQQGVYDLIGNVRERCRDGYQAYEATMQGSRDKEGALQDPVIPPAPGKEGEEMKYVVRGGSFLTTPQEARTYYRDALEGSKRLTDLGFRMVIECPPLTKK